MQSLQWSKKADCSCAFVVSIVDADQAVVPGALSGLHLHGFARRLKAKLRDANIKWAVLGIDYSYNEHLEGRYRPFWLPHVHGLVLARDTYAFLEALPKAFKATNTVARPTKVHRWDGNNRALRYILKPNFERRIGIDNGQRYNKTTGEIRRCRITQYDRIRAADEHELLQHLDQAGFDVRLIFIGCQMRVCEGAPSIVPIKREAS